MSTFALRQPGLHPTALRGPWGTAWGASFGAEKDIVVTMAKLAVKSGFVLLAPEDALGRHGADVELIRYPIETDEAYRTRLAGAWDTWPWAGTATALLTVAAQLDFHGVYLMTGRDWPQGRPDLWARWWLMVDQSNPFSPDGAWDDAGTWDDDGTWDSDAKADQIATVKRAFRQFTNARDAGWVRFLFGATDFYDDGGIWDGGEIVPEHATDDTWVDDPAFFEVRI